MCINFIMLSFFRFLRTELKNKLRASGLTEELFNSAPQNYTELAHFAEILNGKIKQIK